LVFKLSQLPYINTRKCHGSLLQFILYQTVHGVQIEKKTAKNRNSLQRVERMMKRHKLVVLLVARQHTTRPLPWRLIFIRSFSFHFGEASSCVTPRSQTLLSNPTARHSPYSSVQLANVFKDVSLTAEVTGVK